MTLKKVDGKWIDVPTNQTSVGGYAAQNPAVHMPTGIDDVVHIAQEQMIADGVPASSMPGRAEMMGIIGEEMLSESGMQDRFTSLEQEMLENCAKKYGISLGLRPKLAVMGDVVDKIDVILDDSGSMIETSGLANPAPNSIDARLLINMPKQAMIKSIPGQMIRWQEQNIKVKQLLDTALCTAKPGTIITVRPINNLSTEAVTFTVPVFSSLKDKLEVCGGLFKQIDGIKFRGGFTPVMPALRSTPLSPNPHKKTLSLTFSDGQPTEANGVLMKCTPITNYNKITGKTETHQVPTEILNYMIGKDPVLRRDPNKNPVTLCTVGNKNADWMDGLDAYQKTGFPPLQIAELDDIAQEVKEIEKVQGPGFPISLGTTLVAALCPFDHEMDGLDETIASHKMLQSLSGLKYTREEYQLFYNAAIQHQISQGLSPQSYNAHANPTMQPPQYAHAPQYAMQGGQPAQYQAPQQHAYGQPPQYAHAPQQPPHGYPQQPPHGYPQQPPHGNMRR
jgi:hypothetical protein